MIGKFRNILMILFSALTLLSVTSCEPDDWYWDAWWEDSSWETDRRIEEALMGRIWSLTYVEEGYGECPYRSGDEFYFGSNGKFEVRGYENFNERGRWYVERSRVVIDFPNQHDEDLVGKIEELTRHFVALDVKDYDYGSRYYLEFKR